MAQWVSVMAMETLSRLGTGLLAASFMVAAVWVELWLPLLWRAIAVVLKAIRGPQ